MYLISDLYYDHKERLLLLETIDDDKDDIVWVPHLPPFFHRLTTALVNWVVPRAGFVITTTAVANNGRLCPCQEKSAVQQTATLFNTILAASHYVAYSRVQSQFCCLLGGCVAMSQKHCLVVLRVVVVVELPSFRVQQFPLLASSTQAV